MITIHIPGAPVPKARPRATSIGGRPTLYTPAATRAYEQAVKLCARSAMAKAPPLEGAVLLVALITVPVPESWPKARRADAIAGRVWPTSRPDRDNYLKALQDGCNGIVWRDDAQSVAGLEVKRYGETPGVLLAVSRAPAGVADAARRCLELLLAAEVAS